MRTLTLKFPHLGEEVIVLRSLIDVYLKVVGQVDQIKRECGPDDLDNLLTLADVTDRCHEEADRLTRRWCRASALMRQEENEDLESQCFEDKTHGCVALSPAVGPAQEADQGRADTPTADPLFLAQEKQELPEVSASDTHNTALGAAYL